MTLGTRIYTWLKGELVGTDAYGNRYFREKSAPRSHGEKRWVLYNGVPEASKVPPAWHGWLHRTTDLPPTEAATASVQPWQKDHLPNLTGTELAYRPPGSQLERGRRNRATGDYEPWRPS